MKCWVNKLLKVAQILDLGFELGSMGGSRVCSSNMALCCLSLSVSNKSICKLIEMQFLSSYMIVVVLVTQSCPTFCDLMDCSPPGSSVHGLSQARILELVAISFSKESAQSRGRTHISHREILKAGRFLSLLAIMKINNALFVCLYLAPWL